ncbi:putative membrane protein [Mycetocola sp. BIGb0189]|uniref:ECF transporter S component n=1 Tax=Mycetocola sp. BIGb0189 TaxID=2940604 RepID=UPI00216A6867|nr:ECF transporter S component [Mycetocola sp. BIGb0189]MCS4277073.1 putative membrane protein [Mycetocola sp. BIGb0189]
MTVTAPSLLNRSLLPAPWTLSLRVVGIGIVGGLLYGLLGIFSYTLPHSDDVTIRPAIAVLVFLGIRFGPIAGGLVGLIGNPIVDLLQGSSVWTYWDWHLANALVGVIAGLAAFYLKPSTSTRGGIVRLSIISIVALVFGFALTFFDLLRGEGGNSWWAGSYLPTVGWSLVVCLPLVPILESGWRPVLPFDRETRNGAAPVPDER